MGHILRNFSVIFLEFDNLYTKVIEESEGMLVRLGIHSQNLSKQLACFFPSTFQSTLFNKQNFIQNEKIILVPSIGM